MKRVRLLGLFQGVELPDQLELDPNALWLEAHGFSDRRLDTPADTFDPLSDPLDDPFPEEFR